VGLAMVDGPITGASVEASAWEVDIAGIRYPAIASTRPLYDPAAQRVRS
jgi:4-methylaminobutanoate oxidase (formaldehyde-forming)